jgi:hypothetical protein
MIASVQDMGVERDWRAIKKEGEKKIDLASEKNDSDGVRSSCRVSMFD